ncbi:MAG: hypothetical protein HZA80_01165 [Candidatus Taylorbacteria bacterium]|nr:hypothetical protein [Candidatus Taylorbacteria bacterium]
MKWIAISGTWQKVNQDVESDVRREVKNIIAKGDGIVIGGALGVDLFALNEALLNNAGLRIKVCLPVRLPRYAEHYRMRAKEGVITLEQAEYLIEQLEKLYKLNPIAFIENSTNTEINKDTYFERNTKIAELSDELLAFQVNKSEGTQDTIDKARGRGKPVKVFEYTM